MKNNSKLAIESAQRIAEKEVERLISQSAHLQQYHFEPPSLARETPEVWTFCAGSAELIEAGIVPGALHVSVDKTDGHVWSQAELELEAQQHERAAAAGGGKSFRRTHSLNAMQSRRLETSEEERAKV